MRISRMLSGCGLLGLLIACLLCWPYFFPSGPPTYEQAFEENSSRPFVVLGDLQRTHVVERALGREQNDAERERLVEAVRAERPKLVVLLGDLVFDATSVGAWDYTDALLRPLREAGVAVLPALGNHDYWGENNAALRNLERRFAQIASSRWYWRRYGPLGLLWLDSNEEDLGPRKWQAQREWYGETLGRLGGDPRIGGILVFVHHPPFTNSTVTGDERHVQEAFLDGFLASRKALALVSGHAHTYEHFFERGKHFVVSGGGGGPRVALLEGDDRRHEDLFDAPSPRPFQYLLVVPSETDVRIEVRGFQKGEQDLRTIDSFTLPFPRRSIPPVR